MLKIFHKPVLLNEVLDAFGLESIAHLNIAGRYIDTTLGHAGHSIALAKKGVQILGIETDEEMVLDAKERIVTEGLGDKITIVNDNFKNIDRIAQERGFSQVDGILFDLGVSSHHFSSETRGFSFQKPESDLDMRLNPKKQKIKASDLVNILRKDQLHELFLPVLGYVEAKKLSGLIIEKRKVRPIITVGDFNEVINSMGGKGFGRIHPATKAFLALRIAVNGELENIKEALPKSFDLIKKGGRIAVISFHSLEDSLVKKYFNSLVKKGIGKYYGRELIKPTENEISENPLSRSAVLRVIEKIK